MVGDGPTDNLQRFAGTYERLQAANLPLLHFIQESQPEAIGQAIEGWLGRLAD